MDESTPPGAESPPVPPSVKDLPGRSTTALAQDLSGLRRVVYTVRLYGADHEHSRRHAHEIMSQLAPRLKEFSSIDLEVKGNGLEFQGVEVISDPPGGGLADELYRDGIRVLTLRAGLSVEEFLEFLTILGTNFYLPQHQEDTLQGLLWAADLPHIGYEAVQGVEEAVEDSADAGRGETVNFDEICQRILSADASAAGGEYVLQEELQLYDDLRYPAAPDLPQLEGGADAGPGGGAGGAADLFDEDFDLDDLGDSGEFGDFDGLDESDDFDSLEESGASLGDDEDPDAGAVTDDGEGGAAGAGAIDDARNTGERSALAQAYGSAGGALGAGSWRSTASLQTLEFADGEREELDVPPQEIVGLWEEADQESVADLLDKTTAFLMHVALLGDSAIDIVKAAPLLMDCIQGAAEFGLIDRLRSTVEALQGFTDVEDAEAARMASELVARLLDIDLLVRFAHQLDPEDAAAARQLEALLQIGGQVRIRALLDVATEMPDDGFRRYLVQRIVTALQGDPGPLTEGIHRMDPEPMRIRIEALSRMESYSARDQLAALLGHSEPVVRRAAIELIPSSHVRQLWKRLATMLADDRDLQVRCAIIRRMDADRLPALVPLLKRMVTADSFHRRDREEKELAIATLAQDGGDAATATLGELLMAKVRLAAPRQSETRRLAAEGLAHIRSAGARRLLKQAASSLQPGLRKSARDALELAEGRRHGG